MVEAFIYEKMSLPLFYACSREEKKKKGQQLAALLIVACPSIAIPRLAICCATIAVIGGIV